MAKSKMQAARSVIAKVTDETGVEADPLEFLLRIMTDQGSPRDLRVEAAKAALPFAYPKLATVQVTGKDGDPIQIKAITAHVMMNPELADAAERLALGIATGVQAGIEDEADAERPKPRPALLAAPDQP